MFTSYDLHPFTTAVDATVSCPLLPSHVTAAASSAAHLFATRDREKNAKHLAGCVELERAFLAIVFSTLGGIGPPTACAWLDSLFHTALTAEYLSAQRRHGTAHCPCAHQRLIFYQSLQASLARSCSDMAYHLIPTPLATAAATVGAVTLAKTFKRRIIQGEKRLEAIRQRQARRRTAPVLDLEADDATGVYGVRDQRQDAS